MISFHIDIIRCVSESLQSGLDFFGAREDLVLDVGERDAHVISEQLYSASE